jgi:Tol biopolymer transport system component
VALTIGTQLGTYEITALLGKGGMGEVYRARDTRLERDVAIKTLPEEFIADAHRMARFEREAKVLASLNHPNIASIFGMEQSALVMELVEGQLLKGPLPVETALDYAGQIADALETAHEKGIVHRDLKPANIMITPDGVVKILDFGLAAVASASAGDSDPADSPTLTMSLTRTGMIIGTASYLSPEQARGKTVDRRTDIWAFGVVLYEMLTGQRLFGGETVSDTLAAVLKEQPDLEKVPTGLRRLLRSCLEKDRKKRLQAIGDWRLLVEDSEVQVSSRNRSSLPWALTAICAIGVAFALAFVHFRETAPPQLKLRYTVAAPGAVHSFAISPDGRYIAIAAAAINGRRQLWLRALDSLEAQPMQFTEDAAYPFWSHDSQYVAFFAQGSLKKVAASGGPSQTLCPAVNGSGGSWNRDNVIVFSPGVGGLRLQRVESSGGIPTDVTERKGNFRYPVFLPDGRHFLYTNTGESQELTGIYVSSLDGKENRRILPDTSSPVFAPVSGNGIGHLLFVREGTLMAQPFDSQTALAIGDMFPVAEHMATAVTNGVYAAISVSENGVLIYESGSGLGNNQLDWFDRTGKPLGSASSSGFLANPSISPDEKQIAFRLGNGVKAGIWLRDLARSIETPFAVGSFRMEKPFWSPKGDRILFRSDRSGHGDLYQKATSGSGEMELLLSTPNNKEPFQWSPKGFVVYAERDPKTNYDLWVVHVGDNGKPITSRFHS